MQPHWRKCHARLEHGRPSGQPTADRDSARVQRGARPARAQPAGGPRAEDGLHRRRGVHHVRRARAARQPVRQRPARARHRAGAAHPRLHARYARLADGVPRRDQGGRRSGGGQHPAHHRRLRVHAARQPRACASRVSGAAAGVRAAARAAPAPAARHRRGRRSGRASLARATARGGERPLRTCGHDGRRRLLLAVFVGIDGRAQGHRACALEPRHHRGAFRASGDRHPRERRRVLGGEALLRLRPRQWPHVSR